VRIRVDYHQFYVVRPGETEALTVAVEITGGLVRASGRSLAVQCGIALGYVNVSVDVLATEPAEIAPGWDAVVDVPLQVADMCWLLGGDFSTELPVIEQPGLFQVRVHASGRGAEWDLVNDDSQESYLLQMWPSDAPRTHIHLLDPTGRDILAAESGTPPKP